MSYIINKDTFTNNGTKKWIDPGIVSGLDLSVRVERSQNGNPFIELSYSLDDGRKVTRTEWEVKPLPPFEKLSPKMQGVLNKMVESDKNTTKNVQEASALYTEQARNAQVRRLLSVAELFNTSEELHFESESFFEFITFIGSKINDKCKGVKVRAKFVYNHRGFVDTPDYVRAGDPWIEREDEVPAEKSQIKINPAKDKMERPNPTGTRAPKNESPLKDDFVINSPASDDADDLPF